jgi:hypothetical protein
MEVSPSWCREIISSDPHAATELDWLTSRRETDILIGVLLPEDAQQDPSSLQETVASIAREIEVLSCVCETLKVVLVVVTCGVSALHPAAVSFLRSLELHFSPPNRGIAESSVFMRASARRVDVMSMMSSAPRPSQSQPRTVNAILLTPDRSVADSALAHWLMMGVAMRIQPRYVLALYAGTSLAPRSLWELFAAAECSPRMCAAAIGSEANPRSDVFLHPYEVVRLLQTSTGSVSADMLRIAAVPLTPADAHTPVLLRWSALIDGKPGQPTPLNAAFCSESGK